MEMKRFSILIIIACLLSGMAAAQEKVNESGKPLAFINKLKLEKARLLYDHLAYSHAVSLYEELAVSDYKTKEVFPRLGDCYQNLSNTEKAEIWYSKAVKLDSIEPIYYYKYAQVLRSNGKYEESEIWLKRFSELNKTDSRVKNLTDDKNLVEKLNTQKSFYKVKELKNLNSKFADFGAVQLGNKIVFTSGRTENLLVGTYYAWNNNPFLDLYVYDSSALKDNIKQYSKSINTKFHEGPVCFANDNKTLYFTRDNYYKGKRSYNKKGTTCLMIFKADLVNGIWGNITPLPFNNKEYSVGHPAVSPDGKRLYFASDMPGSVGGSDIYYVDILGDNQYGIPVNLGTTVNTEGNEMFPFVTISGLFYSSDGITGLGGLDIFFSHQAANGTWAKPINLGAPINSQKDDFSFFQNSDNRSGFFASNRPGGTGDDDIYAFTLNQLVLKGTVLDTTDKKQPLEKAEVFLLNSLGEVIDKSETDKNGDYTFDVAFDNTYKVKAGKAGYIENSKSVSTMGAAGGEILQNINIGKDKPFMLLGTISDKKTGLKLKDVELTVIDTLKKALILDVKTTEDGAFSTKLEKVQMKSHLVYQIILRKAGYLAKTLVLDHYISNYETNVNEFLEISMDKIAVGADIGKLLNINPIYFDLGKWDIRADAAAELDKIVQAMKDNPTVVIELGSHTDSRGSGQSNLELSDKRAKASAGYIISMGIDSNRIYGKGYGETRLINRCKDGVKCTEQEHAQNRRTEFKVVKF
jgi:outer membrane protein OmpA-like peptidoglycan-associated protein/tetratricopeptide (TPR) repeat protein